ncbi:MAG: TIGR04283 family arsenosugar biosynthesis glycosyltransferase [Maritimibacter sp.]
MRAPLSIVIPTLNAEAQLPVALLCLMEGLEAGLLRELIVSDAESTDKTVEIAQAAGAQVLHGPPGRGGQLARGCAVARGDWLLILHADTKLSPNWSSVVAQALEEASPRYFKLRFDATGFGPWVVSRWANLRARLFSRPFGDQGLLVRRSDYEAAGGYPDIALMEDIALLRKLPKPRAVHVVAQTSWARYATYGWVRQGAGNILRQIRFRLGADPNTLARKYR